MYSKIFSVDYGINKCFGRYAIDLSFTFIHWKTIESLFH